MGRDWRFKRYNSLGKLSNVVASTSWMKQVHVTFYGVGAAFGLSLDEW